MSFPGIDLLSFLLKNKIAFVDTTESMLNEHSSVDPVIFDDGHINAKGHRVFADVIYNELLKLNWITK
jgi:lysophospholipase L1-like esterase